MARSAFGLGFLFTAKDTASPVMRGVDRNFRKMDKSTNRAAQRMQAAQGAMSLGMGALAVGAVGLAGTFKAAFAAGEFEQGVAKVGQISQATAEELEALSNKALQAGIDTQFSPKEAIDGLGELTVRGLSAGEAMTALDGALSLAAGGQISIASASSTTAAALKVFGLEADQAGIAADKLLKISNVTALQAKDLELALGTVGRGASLAKQSIDEMLPSIGLVKNTGVDASVAASSVSSALIFMAKNAKKFDKLKVAVTDANGQFRPFMDIVLDTREAMKGMGDEADKVALSTKLFGRFGVTAFAAIGSQIEKGIRTPTGDIVKGAEAIAFLRDTMKGAEGTAKKFADALLATLPGQIVLLKGSIQTLAIELGKPLAEALKPAVEAIKDGINRVILFVKGLSPEMRKLGSIIFVVASALLALSGVFLVVAATVGLAAPGIAAFVGAISGMAGPLAIVGVGILALIGLFFLLRKAYQENLGGFATFVGPMLDKAIVFFKGLFQFLKDGFLSGDVAKKLSQPANLPILRFFGFLKQAIFRAKKFIKGLVGGFNDFLEKAEPVWFMMINSLRKVEAAIDAVANSTQGALGPSQDFLDAGIMLGRVLARVATIVIFMLAVYIAMWLGFAKGVKKALSIMGPFIDQIVESFSDISGAITDMLVELGLMNEDVALSTDIFEGLGAVLGFLPTIILGPIVAAFTVFTQILKFVLRVFLAVFRLIKSSVTGIIEIFMGFKQIADGDFLGGMKAIGAGIRTIFGGMVDFLGGVFDAIAEQINDLLDLLADVLSVIPQANLPPEVRRVLTAIETRRTSRLSAGADADQAAIDESNQRQKQSFAGGVTIPFANNTAGAAEAQAGGSKGGTDKDAVKQGLLEAAAELNAKGGKQTQKQAVNVLLDGETIATAVEEVNKATAALGFGGDMFEED